MSQTSAAQPAGSMPNLFRLLRGEPASAPIVDTSNPPIAS